MYETWVTPDDDTFWRTKMTTQFFEPSALVVRCALVNKLYHTNVSCEWVSCLHTPSIVWNSLQETEVTTISQMLWAAMNSNSFATAKLKKNTLPTGFTVALCNTAIQSCDRHGDRCFLLLRIADFVVGAVDVVEVSVSEIVAFPPGEHRAFSGIAWSIGKFLSLSKMFLVPISIHTKSPMFGVLQPLRSRSCSVVSFKSDALEKHDFIFRQCRAPPMTFGNLLFRTIIDDD